MSISNVFWITSGYENLKSKANAVVAAMALLVFFL